MRLVVLSGQGLSQAIWTTAFLPALEGGLADLPDVTVVSPPGLRRASLRVARPAWLDAIRVVRRADMVFWTQPSARPHLPLWALGYARPSARRSALVVDAWEPQIGRIGRLAQAQRLAHCFVCFREGAAELSRRFGGGRFSWLPFGFDETVFRDLGLERDIFAYWMGRRHEPLHQKLIEYCESRGLVYRYSQRGGEFPDPHDLNRVVARSRYFVVTPPNLDNPTRTGDFSPVVMRYLEGPAAGSRLLGVRPNRNEFLELLPESALVECAPDGSDLEAVLDRDVSDPEAQAKRQEASELVRREHGWRNRAKAIHARLSQLDA